MKTKTPQGKTATTRAGRVVCSCRHGGERRVSDGPAGGAHQGARVAARQLPAPARQPVGGAAGGPVVGAAGHRPHQAGAHGGRRKFKVCN